MVLKDSKIVQFNLQAKTANLVLTPKRSLLVDASTLFVHDSGKGYSGYFVYDLKNHQTFNISSRVAKQIAKYFIPDGKDICNDYYRFKLS